MGIAVHVLPLSRAVQARTLDGVMPGASGWSRDGRVRFRQDGVRQVIGHKVFAMDIRAADMPGWPRQEAHAALLRVTRTDRIYTGFDLSALGAGLQPDRIVTAETLAADGVRMPGPDFYGELLLESGKTPTFLGQPVAFLIWRDFARFHAARRALRNHDVIRYGGQTPYVERPPYLEARFVRVGGRTPDATDIFSPMQDGVARRAT